MGASAESPFAVAVDAGAAALPTLLKMTAVMTAKGQPWEGLEQLPLEVELPPRFAFHSVFACPVARDQSTPDNPPMILPCGYAAKRCDYASRGRSRSPAMQPGAVQAVHSQARARKRTRVQVPLLPGACLRSVHATASRADALVLCPDRGCRQPMQGDQVLGLRWDANDLRELLPPPDWQLNHAFVNLPFAFNVSVSLAATSDVHPVVTCPSHSIRPLPSALRAQEARALAV